MEGGRGGEEEALHCVLQQLHQQCGAHMLMAAVNSSQLTLDELLVLLISYHSTAVILSFTISILQLTHCKTMYCTSTVYHYVLILLLKSHRISSAPTTLITCLTQIQDSVWVWFMCVCARGFYYCTHKGLGDRHRRVQKGNKGCA